MGSSLVGLGNSKFGGVGLGLPPDTNAPYGINEFAEYDPITPKSWFTSWVAANGTLPGVSGVFVFAPGIKDARIARRYGVSYVLEPTGSRLPGGTFVRRIGSEDLYRVSGSSRATLVPATASGTLPAVDSQGEAVPIQWLSPSKAQVKTDSSSAQVLRLRVASLPGWHATIDGRALPLTPYLTMMFQAHVPPGHHVIELTYWPTRFTDGIAIAAVTVVAIVVVGIIGRRRSSTADSRGGRVCGELTSARFWRPTPTIKSGFEGHFWQRWSDTPEGPVRQAALAEVAPGWPGERDLTRLSVGPRRPQGPDV